MSDEIVRRILGEMEHDSEREDSLRRMIASAFEARTRVYTILVGIVVVVAMVIAVWVAILFFQTEVIRDMILYATLFNTCMLAIASVRLFLWQFLLRQGVIREIKRLELRVLESMNNASTARVSPIQQDFQESQSATPASQ
jgi:ABC-type sugar transport system permease subunit